MTITINGKIAHVLPPKKGVSQSTGKEWVSQDFVIETENGDSICFNIFGLEKIQQSGLKNGVTASVTCDIKSKEWNGKWFTSVSCTSCIVQGSTQTNQTKPQTITPPPVERTASSTDIDSLPF
jgi:hypothetical protein